MQFKKVVKTTLNFIDWNYCLNYINEFYVWPSRGMKDFVLITKIFFVLNSVRTLF